MILREMIDDMMMMNDFAVPFFLLMQRVNECNTTQTTLLYLFIFRCDLIFFTQ